MFSVIAFSKSGSARGKRIVTEISFNFQMRASCFIVNVMRGMKGVRCASPFL